MATYIGTFCNDDYKPPVKAVQCTTAAPEEPLLATELYTARQDSYLATSNVRCNSQWVVGWPQSVSLPGTEKIVVIYAAEHKEAGIQ